MAPVCRFHYYTLADVDGDLAELNRRHQQLAPTLETGSPFACLFHCPLVRRADIN